MYPVAGLVVRIGRYGVLSLFGVSCCVFVVIYNSYLARGVQKMTNKRKKAKPVRAWVIISPDGWIVFADKKWCIKEPPTRAKTIDNFCGGYWKAWKSMGCRCVRVEIREAKGK